MPSHRAPPPPPHNGVPTRKRTFSSKIKGLVGRQLQFLTNCLTTAGSFLRIPFFFRRKFPAIVNIPNNSETPAVTDTPAVTEGPAVPDTPEVVEVPEIPPTLEQYESLLAVCMSHSVGEVCEVDYTEPMEESGSVSNATMCDTCNEQIEGRSISALGKCYHPDHFLCDVCKTPITEATFHQVDGKPLCPKDYEATCPLCASCDQPITNRIVRALGRNYHEEHFVCHLCQDMLVGGEYHERDAQPICHACYIARVADKCKACGEPIANAATVALDAKWHPDCFKCNRCNKAITTHTFKVDGTGLPLCDTC